MPLAGVRSFIYWRHPIYDFKDDICDIYAKPLGHWPKISAGIYFAAMMPALLQSIADANLWQISGSLEAGLETASAAAFVANGMFDLVMTIFLGDGTCSVALDGVKSPRWAERRPRLGRFLRTPNWFFYGSFIYITGAAVYLAGPISYYYASSSLETYDIMNIMGASVYVFHAIICIVGTLVDNAEVGTRRTNLLFWRCKRWQDFDWYILADATFLTSAIFDVLMDFKSGMVIGYLISSLNWILNACFYMIAAFADDAVTENYSPRIDALSDALILDSPLLIKDSPVKYSSSELL